ncbi:MAG: primosomal protein N', partial [Bacteroidales bacterium]
MTNRTTYFVDILLPLPLPGLFTYRIPHDFDKKVSFGVRAVVPFGKSKLYSGLVVKIHEQAPQQINTKYIIDIIDEKPIISFPQYQLWEWISQYYLCTLGEVMTAALPSALKIASETKILLHPAFDGDVSILSDRELRLVE